jgi:hypothetical protein
MDKVTRIDSPSRKPAVRRKKESLTRRSPRSREYWERATKVYELRIGGHLPVEIAAILEIRLEDVYRLMSERFAFDATYLDDQERKNILAMELVRLEALQVAIWPSAMMGDPKAVDSALKIIQTRARITGLEQVDPVVQKNLVLVMGEKEEDFIKSLKAAGTDE